MDIMRKLLEEQNKKKFVVGIDMSTGKDKPVERVVEVKKLLEPDPNVKYCRICNKPLSIGGQYNHWDSIHGVICGYCAKVDNGANMMSHDMDGLYRCK